MELGNPCNNCCTSTVYWKTGCLNECKSYKHYVEVVDEYFQLHGELPKYEWTQNIKFRANE